MTYKELQEKATQLGIKAVGVKREELERLVQEAESNNTDTPTTEKTSENIKEEFNAALVFNANREVRRYTLEDHGENFVNLANQYAGHRGFDVDLVKLEPKIICPSCGHGFNP